MVKGSTKINIDLQSVIKCIRNGSSISDLSFQLNINRSTLTNYLNKEGLNKKNILFNERFFENIDTESKAYWFGFVMADGCVSMTHSPKLVINLAKKDKHHLLKFHKDLESLVKIYDCADHVSSQHYSKKMCMDLISHGCVPKKSLILEFPNVNSGLINHFVRGYFDGDGCAELRTHQKTPQLRLSFIGTDKFLSELQRIMGVSNKLYPCGNNKVARCLQICGNNKATKIAEWMYKDASVYLERKKEVWFASLRV